jgi:hypothetical protein
MNIEQRATNKLAAGSRELAPPTEDREWPLSKPVFVALVGVGYVCVTGGVNARSIGLRPAGLASGARRSDCHDLDRRCDPGIQKERRSRGRNDRATIHRWRQSALPLGLQALNAPRNKFHRGTHFRSPKWQPPKPKSSISVVVSELGR